MDVPTLYFRTTCGYSRKVLAFLDANKISLNLKNVSASPEIRQELLDIAGKTQVPCLVVDGKPMHESEIIMEWLKNNWRSNDHKGN